MDTSILKKYLIFSILLIPFSPRFGSIDIIGVQWLLLSLIVFFFSFTINNFNFKSNLIFKFLSLFQIFCLLSFFYSNNLVVSILDYSRICIIYFLVIILLNNYSNISFPKKIEYFIALIIISELSFSLLPLFYEFVGIFTNYSYSDLSSSLFVGLGANKNITAASVAIKIPILLYYISERTKLFYFHYFLLLLTFIDITFLNTRSVFLSTSLILCLFLFYSLYHRKLLIQSFISILLFCISFFINYLIIPNDSNSITRFSSIELSEESSSGRFELWSNAIDYFLNHPFYGCGLGNWKIESLPYWYSLLSGYSVPYHAHNDFLELLTEIGFLGALVYLLIFLTSFYRCYYNLFLKFNKIYLFLSLSLVIYFIDAFFNFPLERTQMQIYFAILIFLIIKYDIKKA